MELTKSETNNAIITTLSNVRKHPNADHIKLATVLGTQVVVWLDAQNGEEVVYFDSNLQLSHAYLSKNNLYAKEYMHLNEVPTVAGYFGKNGRVRARKFRDEVSNGYVAPLESLVNAVLIKYFNPKVGDEFTHINGVEICRKFIIPVSHKCKVSRHGKRKYAQPFYLTYLTSLSFKKKSPGESTDMFWRHWDTKQLMRGSYRMAKASKIYVEEKIHGTSGRTGHVLFNRNRKWYQVWKPKRTPFWKVVSGTRRRDATEGHMRVERKIIHEKLAPHIRKGEEVYYEIYGYELGGGGVQKGYPYGCKCYSNKEAFETIANSWDKSLPFKVMLYRVTITTEDGFKYDLSREQVYRRAEELGLEKPTVLYEGNLLKDWEHEVAMQKIIDYAQGQSHLDENTLLEGVVVWFEDIAGNWSCLKHKSEEFLEAEDRNRDKGIGDVEDGL